VLPLCARRKTEDEKYAGQRERITAGPPQGKAFAQNGFCLLELAVENMVSAQRSK
jgi:hypothetical protein